MVKSKVKSSVPREPLDLSLCYSAHPILDVLNVTVPKHLKRWFCLELNEVTDDDSVLGVETRMAGTVTGLGNSNYKWFCSPCLEETQKASPDSMSVANSWSLCSIYVCILWSHVVGFCPNRGARNEEDVSNNNETGVHHYASNNRFRSSV